MKIIILSELFLNYEQTYIFHISITAILDFCTFACVKVIDFDFFEFLIPENLCVVTKVMSRHRFFMLVWRPSWIYVHFIALSFLMYFLHFSYLKTYV